MPRSPQTACSLQRSQQAARDSPPDLVTTLSMPPVPLGQAVPFAGADAELELELDVEVLVEVLVDVAVLIEMGVEEVSFLKGPEAAAPTVASAPT